MFKDIEELMGAIDSFKSNMENTDELLAQLKKASQRMENTDELLAQLKKASQKIEQAEVQIQNDHQEIQTSLAKYSRINKIMMLGFILLAALMVFLKYI